MTRPAPIRTTAAGRAEPFIITAFLETARGQTPAGTDAVIAQVGAIASRWIAARL